MLKKTIPFEDFNGVKRKEDFYFNLTEAELTEMEMSTEGGLQEQTKRMIASKDGKAIINFFKNLVLKAYGEKSLDGRNFVKNDALRDNFASTNAYSILFMELATDADKAGEFVNGILPNSLDKNELKKLTAEKMAELEEDYGNSETTVVNA